MIGTCETITFIFDSQPDEKKLKHIADILSESSGGLVRIRYIDTENGDVDKRVSINEGKNKKYCYSWAI